MSTPKPSLTVAVPVFQAERYLPETLRSLNEQGPWLRWWLQDGASKDRTIEIAYDFARPGDKVVSEPDHGQTDALNRAISRMGGEIITFLNGDDLYTPGTAERVVEFFQLHPHIDLIYGCVNWIDEHSRVTGFHRGRIDSLADMLDVYHVWWRQRQWVQPEVFFRRSLFEKVGGFQTKWSLAFDYDFWVRCLRAGARVAHVPAITVQFRLHAAQKSTAAELAASEIRAIVKEHLNDGASIGLLRRLTLRANHSYDLYQLGQLPRQHAFFWALLTHPTWLLSSFARNRAQSSLAKLIPFRRRKLQ